MIVYKKLLGNLIATLRVDGQDNCNRKGVINPDYAKFRCNKATVISIQHMISKDTHQSGQSWYNPYFEYKVGETIEINECVLDDVPSAPGIHFFKTYEAAYYFLNTFPSDNNYTGDWKTFGLNGELECIRSYENGEEIKAVGYKSGNINSIRTQYPNAIVMEAADPVNKKLYVSEIFLRDGSRGCVALLSFNGNSVKFYADSAMHNEYGARIVETINSLPIDKGSEILTERATTASCSFRMEDNSLLKLELQRLSGQDTDVPFRIEKLDIDPTRLFIHYEL